MTSPRVTDARPPICSCCYYDLHHLCTRLNTAGARCTCTCSGLAQLHAALLQAVVLRIADRISGGSPP